MKDRDPQKEQDFHDKYGGSMGGGTTNKIIPKGTSYRIVFDSDKKIMWVVFLDDDMNVIEDFDAHGLCYAESVKEFKIQGDSDGGWEEVTQHRVWILLKSGQKKCPWCGGIPEDYDGFNDPSYIGDHRVGQCGICKRFAFVSHDHIEGRCQLIPPESLKNFKKVE